MCEFVCPYFLLVLSSAVDATACCCNEIDDVLMRSLMHYNRMSRTTICSSSSPSAYIAASYKMSTCQA